MMSQEHELPDDPSFNKKADLDAERLEEIELQLKRIRPISAHMDLEAIAQIAQEAPELENSPMLAPKRAESTHSYGSSRDKHFYRAIVASWTCGALAGAILVLLFVRWSRPTVPEHEPARLADGPGHMVVVSPPRTDDTAIRPQKDEVVVHVSNTSAQPLDAAWLVSSALSDPLRDYPSSRLRAGVHLPGLAQNMSLDTEQRTAAMAAIGTDFSSSDMDPRLAQESEFKPAPEVTRGNLLRRLREDSFQLAL